MQEFILTKIGPLLLSATPISLILINLISRFFSKHNPKLGNTTTICTNLTKTLTKDSLIVRTILFDKHKAKIDDEESLIKITDTENKENELLIERQQLQKDEILKQMALITTLCQFEKLKSIEKVIKNFFTTCGLNKQKLKEEYEIIANVPSIPEKKLSTVIAVEENTKEIFALTKGNPLSVLKKCTKTYINGKKVDLTPHTLRKIRKRIQKLNKNGEKAIGFAIKPLPKKRLKSYTEQFAENEMTYLGTIGITSPLNKDLQQSIKLAKKADIKIYILTKAKERKAMAIGRLLNLINPQYSESITGDYLRKLPDQKIAKMLSNKEKDYIFAELKKEDKSRIIEILRDLGETVATIRKNSGNKFKDVVEGIRKGRIINRNYQKFANHAISCKIAELILIITAFLMKAPTPLSITLILSLDIFINLTLELSLRANRTEKDVMTPKYHPVNTKLLNRRTLPHLLTNSLSIGVIISGVYIWSLLKNGWTIGEKLAYDSGSFTKSAAITFVLLAVIQIINAFSLRRKFSLTKNIYLLLTAILSILIIYTFTTFPIFTDLLRLNQISFLEWQIILFCTFLIILIEEFRKYLLRKNESKNSG